MNKVFLFLSIALFAILPCQSQTLSDGRVWNFVQRMYEHDNIEKAYTVSVSGDTIANGQQCKKLVKVYQEDPDHPTTFAAFEKDAKIYGVFGEETKLLLDFSLRVGDKANEFGTVSSVDYIDINNVRHKRITIFYDKYNYYSYLVDGIGWSSTKYSAYEVTSYYDVLVSVSENGKCIFKDSDFSKHPTGIDNKPEIEKKDDAPWYDLSGRRVLVPQKGRVYIKGNKKVIQ